MNVTYTQRIYNGVPKIQQLIEIILNNILFCKQLLLSFVDELLINNMINLSEHINLSYYDIYRIYHIIYH